MELRNKRYYDEFGNSWSAATETLESATAKAASLYKCYDCQDCENCSSCSNCENCTGCGFCVSCHRLNKCYGCFSCFDCYKCDKCDRCSSCRHCISVTLCDNFRNNPSAYLVPKGAGADEKSIQFYWDKTKVHVCCDWFGGPLDAFEKYVVTAHAGKPSAAYYSKALHTIHFLVK